MLNNNEYKEVIKYIDDYKITNMYPILTKDEKEKREQEILTKLYYSFTKINDA